MTFALKFELQKKKKEPKATFLKKIVLLMNMNALKQLQLL